MSRARAAALVLVNWKGVFYERYLLDPHVTALEGTNGAGKTTVMIAAYVVLLPDMTRLRFTNVGETGATGGDKGISGRLGEQGRPSYAVTEFRLAKGERLVAGVHLERKGDTAVEPTPFVVTGLADDVSLQDILLLRIGDQEHVPDIPELRENVAKQGGRLQMFASAKDYFIALFDHGVTPLLLTTDDERGRFNDMLRTSMTGGISRALTSDFRSFLLKEETGLADTLGRMLANLEACRRTRSEVREAREVEREISGVFDVGQAMFVAAMLAARERTDELQKRVDVARKDLEQRQRDHDAIAQRVEELAAERLEADVALDAGIASAETARTQQERVERAHGVARRVSELAIELENAARVALDAAARQASALQTRLDRERENERARDHQQKAVLGLANFQQGLDVLHRRASEHRIVVQRLDDARRALGFVAIEPAALDEVLLRADQRLLALDEERTGIDRQLGGAEAHRRLFDEGLSALTRIEGKAIDTGQASVVARRILDRARNWESLAARRDEIGVELDRTQRLAERQAAARSLAERTSEDSEPLNSAARVSAAATELEEAIRGYEVRIEEAAIAAVMLGQRRESAVSRRRELERDVARWHELDVVTRQLEQSELQPLRTRAAIVALHEALLRRHAEATRSIEQRGEQRRTLAEEVRALEHSAGSLHEDLLRARDLIDGELVASLYEDVAPEDAGRVQAMLGPLADAILVDDPRTAVSALVDRDRTIETIRLVDAREVATLSQPPQDTLAGRDVVIDDGRAIRITRVSERPTLGRAARARRVAELRGIVERISAEQDALEVDLGRIAALRQTVDTVLAGSEVLERGDPSAALAQALEEGKEVEAEERRQAAKADEGRRRAVVLRRRAAALRELLPEAWLLDQPDLASRVEALAKESKAAASAARELERTAADRKLVESQLVVLQTSPPSQDELAAMREALKRLNGVRDEVFRGSDALEYVRARRDALEWTDAEAALQADQAVLPTLQAQCDIATKAEEAARVQLRSAEDEWRSAAELSGIADAERIGAAEAMTRARAELDEIGVDDPSDRAVDAARARARETKTRVDELRSRVGEVDREGAGYQVRLEQALKSLQQAESQLGAVEAEFRPAREDWDRLREKAERDGLLAAVLTSPLAATVGSGSVRLRSDAKQHASVLLERLGGAKGGDEILERVRSFLRDQDQTAGEGYLQAWVLVRQWLRRRVPAQVSEVADPLEAMQQLRRHLGALEDRLVRQEADLCGASEDVARGIEVHIRKANAQIRKLNHDLDGVRFGTIRSIRIRLQRDERMERVLAALREGAAQTLLFQTSMPVEEAFDELFRRYGGGRTGGQRLLDYREYVELAIEVKRQAATEWEIVNPSRVSTGEAIGIGAALMMVVLTAWERSANPLRPKRSEGTLRWLFLDEANRLSHDNLAVLFDLCANLELQLLIAAPEVAQAKGCTAYRLVRQVGADDREEVIVSGRRARAID